MSAASDLTQASWQQFSQLLDEALELPLEQRLAWLDALGAEHEPLKPMLRKVLARQAGVATGQWMHTLPHSEGAMTLLADGELQAGALVGPYRLIRELGEGGMGSVWLAERADGTLKRQVALKLPRASWSRGLAERMARERDILAGLEHPNIARLYDAGSDAQGRPYLALEYVEGQAIDVYCRERALGVRERVTLLVQVAQAVAFAHSRLVVHRDLKPSNILVTGDGQVRLLDFGIAKLMEGDSARETELTQLSGRALTLSYASPEQIRGETITTTTDVYSLGVVAFELLTGRKPYVVKGSSAAELQRAVLEFDAATASSVVSDSALRKALHGDLDAILRQALNKVAGRRYATVAAMADDLERHLRGDPVQAQPDRALYRLGKFVNRNRTAVVAMAAVFVALSIGAAIALWQARVARQEARTAKAVQEFVLDIFRANTSNAENPAKARATTARELLDRGAERVDQSLMDAPEARLQMLKMLGSMYVDLELEDKAAAIDEKIVQAVRRQGSKRELAEALINYAHALHATAQRDKILPVLEEARSLLDSIGDRSSPSRGQLFVRLAQRNYNVSLPKAIEYADEARRIFRASAEYANSQWLATAYILGARARAALAEYAAAARDYREALRLLEALPQPPNLDITIARYSLAELLFVQQRFDEAIEFVKMSYDGANATLGPNSPISILCRARVAATLHALGDTRGALKELRDSHRHIIEVKGGSDSLYTSSVRRYLARALFAEGQISEAATLIEQVAAGNRIHYAGSFVLGSTLLSQAAVDIAQGRHQEAMQLIDEAEGLIRKATGDAAKAWRYNEAHLLRARLHLAQGNATGALRSLDSFIPLPEQERPEPAADTIERDTLAALAHLDDGKPTAALAAARAATDGASKLAARGGPPVIEAEAALAMGVVLMRTGRPDQAKPWIERALAIRRSIDADTSPWLGHTLAIHGQLMRLLGDDRAASAALRQANRIFAAHPRLSPSLTSSHRDLQRMVQAN